MMTNEIKNALPTAGTMLDLVSALSDYFDADLEAVCADLINSGRYTLTGNFRGCAV